MADMHGQPLSGSHQRPVFLMPKLKAVLDVRNMRNNVRRCKEYILYYYMHSEAGTAQSRERGFPSREVKGSIGKEKTGWLIAPPFSGTEHNGRLRSS